MPDWSGLDQTADRSEVPSFAPTQWRGAGYKARLKCYEKMSEPLATKFKEGMDTKIFIDEVKEHNERYGLNTWHYLPDPTDPSRMANVVKENPLFTYQVDKSVAEAATFAELNYDEFDQENTMAAASFVLESLSADLKIGITIMMAPGERNIFTCVWIRLMGRLNQMGTRYIEKVKDQIRSCLPNQFSKENIEDWYKSIHVPIEKLMAAHAYDHSLTKAILSNLFEFCSVEGNFHHEANFLLSKITPEV